VELFLLLLARLMVDTCADGLVWRCRPSRTRTSSSRPCCQGADLLLYSRQLPMRPLLQRFMPWCTCWHPVHAPRAVTHGDVRRNGVAAGLPQPEAATTSSADQTSPMARPTTTSPTRATRPRRATRRATRKRAPARRPAPAPRMPERERKAARERGGSRGPLREMARTRTVRAVVCHAHAVPGASRVARAARRHGRRWACGAA
jgi:hypothetical protein